LLLLLSQWGKASASANGEQITPVRPPEITVSVHRQYERLRPKYTTDIQRMYTLEDYQIKKIKIE
jgi:hypothetical protein